MKDLIKTLKERNQHIELETGLRTIIAPKKSKKLKSLSKYMSSTPFTTFKLDGNFEEIIKKVNRNLLVILAKTLADSAQNKDLKIDMVELLKKLEKKYLK